MVADRCAVPEQHRKTELLSGSVLKLIAIVSMLIDHSALILARDLDWLGMTIALPGRSVTVYFILRKIGRLAFPLFCFLLVEGFVHTRNRTKYAMGLLIFALVSEIPWNYMVSGKWLCPEMQNVYFTLFLGVLLMCLLAWDTQDWKKYLCLAGLYVLVRLLHADYGVMGVLLIGILYILRSGRVERTVFAFPLLFGGIAALCAFFPINLYNGERGFVRGKAMKYAFYLFYPLHITVLLGIRWLMR